MAGLTSRIWTPPSNAVLTYFAWRGRLTGREKG